MRMRPKLLDGFLFFFQTRKFLLVCRISAVEKVEDSVFGKSNVFQVILDNPVDGSKDIHYLLAKVSLV